MSKYNGATKKKREERDTKKRDGVGSMIASIAGQTQKFINEWSEKHNQLAKLVDSVFKIATQEVGKLWGNQQRVVDSIEHIDLNVLAIADLDKRIFLRLATLDAKMSVLEKLADVSEFSDEQKAVVHEAGLAAYTESVKKSFEEVFERRRKEDVERKAAAEKAALEAKAAEEAKTEAVKAEAALAEAEKELVTNPTSGGKGVEIPEGAQVFGGA